MTRPLAVVSKNAAGSNSAFLAALRFVPRLAGLDLGAAMQSSAVPEPDSLGG
jgi:hypothetical protein